jgi:signal transduction histidine kinase
VSAVVNERVGTWRPLAEESGVRIRVDAPPAGPALSMAGGVEQIVDNLVDNALAVTPSGAAIEIAVRPDDRAVVLTIADRGPGMTADQIVRSFDRFWRAADADHPGTGLGLAVVQQLAEAGGGDVELAARDGGGLVATVRFSR